MKERKKWGLEWWQSTFLLCRSWGGSLPLLTSIEQGTAQEFWGGLGGCTGVMASRRTAASRRRQVISYQRPLSLADMSKVAPLRICHVGNFSRRQASRTHTCSWIICWRKKTSQNENGELHARVGAGVDLEWRGWLARSQSKVAWMDEHQVTIDRVTMNDERVTWDCGSARPVGEEQTPTFFSIVVMACEVCLLDCSPVRKN
jgi:hypothetical protein